PGGGRTRSCQPYIGSVPPCPLRALRAQHVVVDAGVPHGDEFLGRVAPDHLAQRAVHRVFLGRGAQDLLGPGQQVVVYIDQRFAPPTPAVIRRPLGWLFTGWRLKSTCPLTNKYEGVTGVAPPIAVIPP